MKKFLKLSLAVVMLFFMFSCEDSSTDPKDESVNEFEVLINYLESGDTDHEAWVNNMSGWIVGSIDSNATYDEFYILDFRSQTAYDAKHIPGAVLTDLSSMFDDAAQSTKDSILCVCYSGQTASFAHMLLRMKGYNAFVLKFGMSSYHPSTDSWTGNIGSNFVSDAAWVKTASPALPTYDYPTLNTNMTTAEDILDARIDEAIAVWPVLVSASEAVTNRTNYNIINYWPTSDATISDNPYTYYGHIDGSYQVAPNTLTQTENLNVFDPDGTNILYCWTGQTAAATIAYLTVLGYDVKSIKFGVNSMIWSELQSHKWSMPW